MKQRICTLLALLLVCTLSATALAAPEWLNTDSAIPIVKEGHEKDVRLSVAVRQTSLQGNAEDIWFWEYAKQRLGLNIDVTQVQNPSEYLNLTLASGDMPDILINMGVSTQQMVTYGTGEGMFLPINEYIDEYMPSLAAIYAEHPEYREAITAPDGNIYALGNIGDAKSMSGVAQWYIQQAWLYELEIPLPTTIDEFLDAMRAFKARDPECVPYSGAYNNNNPGYVLLTALGFTTNNGKGTTISMRNGAPVFPFADREAWGEYLRVLNTMYSENLMSRDFFTMDQAAVYALIASDKGGISTVSPHAAGAENYTEWWTPAPLTSAYNDTPVWPTSSTYLSTGGWVISSDCKYPEAACRLADFWFDQETNALAGYGPMAGSEDTLGKTSGWWFDTSNSWVKYDDIINDPDNLYNGMEYNYRMAKIGIFTGMSFGDTSDFGNALAKMAGVERENGNFYDNMSDPNYFWQCSMYYNIMPHLAETYPTIVFFSDEENQAITDLRSVIVDYAEAESAKFVTGQRPLTDEELTAYFDELDNLGYQELLSYYVTYYNEVVAG